MITCILSDTEMLWSKTIKVSHNKLAKIYLFTSSDDTSCVYCVMQVLLRERRSVYSRSAGAAEASHPLKDHLWQRRQHLAGAGQRLCPPGEVRVCQLQGPTLSWFNPLEGMRRLEQPPISCRGHSAFLWLTIVIFSHVLCTYTQPSVHQWSDLEGQFCSKHSIRQARLESSMNAWFSLKTRYI